MMSAGRRLALQQQPDEFGLAGDLVHDFGRKADELLLDVFRIFRPDAVGVRVGDL
jgi:hypothetical protein